MHRLQHHQDAALARRPLRPQVTVQRVRDSVSEAEKGGAWPGRAQETGARDPGRWQWHRAVGVEGHLRGTGGRREDAAGALQGGGGIAVPRPPPSARLPPVRAQRPRSRRRARGMDERAMQQFLLPGTKKKLHFQVIWIKHKKNKVWFCTLDEGIHVMKINCLNEVSFENKVRLVVTPTVE